MLQFLRFDASQVDRSEFQIISGTDAFKFFSKRIMYFILLVYSTFFLAVAIPFQYTYFIGGFVIVIFLVRLINHAIKFSVFKDGKIIIDKEGVEIFFKDDAVKISADNITYLEVNLFGNLVVREKYNKTGFPLMLIDREKRPQVLSLFQDMAPKRTAVYKKIWDFVDAVFVAFLLAMHIRQFIIQAYFIPTGSMEDTLQIGDHLLVEKITLGPSIPRMIGMEEKVHLDFLGIRVVQRGDIVIFRPPHEKEKDFIKRCIAVAGDDFSIRDGYVYINGKKKDESYVKGFTDYSGFGDKKIEGKIPEGHIVVLGDNRQNSYDSRGFGYLPIKRIKGKAFILYWNTKQIMNFDFSRFGLIR